MSAAWITGDVFNAEASFKGGEVELTVVPVRNLTLAGNLAYVSPRYQRIIFRNPVTTLLRNYSDTARFANISKWSGNAAIDYDFEPWGIGQLAAHLDYSFQSKRQFSISPDSLAPLAGLIASKYSPTLNGRLALRDIPVGSGKIEIAAWMNNIANKFNRRGGIDFAFDVAGNLFDPPRTFGIDLKADF